MTPVTRPTTFSAGTLLMNVLDAVPARGSLTIGPDGTFIFDPSAIAAPRNASATFADSPVQNILPSPPAPLPKGEGSYPGDLAWH